LRDKLTTFWDEKFIGWPEWSEEPIDVETAKKAISKPSDNNVTSFKIRPQDMILRNNIAIIHYSVDIHSESKDEKKSTATYRITHTWLYENGMWQILSGMSAK